MYALVAIDALVNFLVCKSFRISS